ncbi:Uncharacterised protein [Mycobacteroides abscessus subsp. abscessus]|nr:Uncharacterised protein [Mycobacteroides abscessus subsp. abscessus]
MQVGQHRKRGAVDTALPGGLGTELEHPKAERVFEVLALHPAELHEALQDAMRRRAREIRAAGQFGERERPLIIAVGGSSMCAVAMNTSQRAESSSA